MTLPMIAENNLLFSNMETYVPERNAALVYLASLPAKTGRNTQAQVLRVMADWLGGTLDTIDWSKLRYEHCAALRSTTIVACTASRSPVSGGG